MGLVKDIYGTIMFDEDEVRSDIEEIKSACELLNKARKLLTCVDKGRFEGEARSLLDGHVGRINKSLAGEIDACDKTSKLIKSVLDKYIKTDRDLDKLMRG
jgi:hypothetical protein